MSIQIKRTNGKVVLPDFYDEGLALVIEDDVIHINVPGYHTFDSLPTHKDSTKELVLSKFILSHFDPHVSTDVCLIKEFCDEFIEPSLKCGGLLPQDTIKDWLFYHGRKNEHINSN